MGQASARRRIVSWLDEADEDRIFAGVVSLAEINFGGNRGGPQFGRRQRVFTRYERGRNAISGSWVTSRRRSFIEPLYRQPSRRRSTQRMIGAINQLRCS